MRKMTLIILLSVFFYQLKAQDDPPRANYWIDLGISGFVKFDSYLGVTLAYNRSVYKDLFIGAGYSLAVNFDPGSATFQTVSLSFGKQFQHGLLHFRPRLGVNGIFESSTQLFTQKSLLGLNFGADAAFSFGFLGIGVFGNYYYNKDNDFFELGAKYCIGRFVDKEKIKFL